jgi:hypothetical protein
LLEIAQPKVSQSQKQNKEMQVGLRGDFGVVRA